MSGGKKLAELTDSEVVDLCHGAADDYPKKTYACPNGDRTFGVDDAACDDTSGGFEDISASCTATVGDLKDCYDTLYGLSNDEYCGLTGLPAECAEVIACQQDDGTRTASDSRAWIMAQAARLR